METKFLDRIAAMERRYEELERLMAQPEVASDQERLTALARERAALEDTVSLYREHRQVARGIHEARALTQESADEEMRNLAKEELTSLEKRQEELENKLRVAMLPRDPNDERDVIVEVRAGAGGEEAALFASELYRMYTRYAQRHGWKVEFVERNATGIGGIKEIVFEVRGKGAYSRLKHESGTHRVQRVPVTESGGRIHTSTATVAVLPEADEVEVKISPDELRIETMRAGGHGGQNVQKVESAVRITHIPTGLVASCSDERSQFQNRVKAMAHLRARLYEMERQRREREVTASRRAQVGTAERAEKIRTYNYPQNRMTDHRIGVSVHNLSLVLDGDLDGLIDALIAHEHGQRLEEALASG